MKRQLDPEQIKRYEKKVYRVLHEQNFIIGSKEKEKIAERISNGRRYFYLLAKRREGKKTVERFIKVPENNSRKLLLPFQRQIELAKYAKERKIIKTRGVVDYNYDPKKGIPFAVIETFPAAHAKIGFIEKGRGSELLTCREAGKVIEQLKKLHAVPVGSLPPKLKNILRKDFKDDYKSFTRQVLGYFNKKVLPLDAKSKQPEHFHQVMERRLGISGLKEKIRLALSDLQPIIDAKENHAACLVHGDLAPNNLYVFDSGEVEFLDLEWAGIFRNKALGMIYDFGNLRARAWNNENFQKGLDESLIKSYKKEGREELGRAIVFLGILRSSAMLAGYFENYDWTRQEDTREKRRRSAIERDVIKILK